MTKSTAKIISLRSPMDNKVIKKRLSSIKDLEKELSDNDIKIEADSDFEKSLKKSRKKLKKANIPDTDPQYSIAMLKAALSMILAMIPKAEAQFNKYKNERAAYAVVSLINTARELIVDLRQLTSNNDVAEHITNNIITPSMKLIAQSFVDSCQELKTKSKQKNFDSKAEINKMMAEHAAFVNQIINSVSSNVHSYYKKN